jgi:methylase of polypeptide subunit release factors
MNSAPEARAALGQWFTPSYVVDLALGLLGALPKDARLLDPCCGDGAFLARAVSAGLAGECAGIDVDAAAVAACRQAVPDACIERADLFDVDPDPSGFDAVVGNPPYVRGERLSATQKERIRRRLRADWPALPGADLDALVGRADLAAPCILRALRMARPGARVVLVLSSAMLDAGYAGALWSLIGQVARVRAIVEAAEERWFEDAAVNAMIVVLERKVDSQPVAVARLTASTERAAARVRDVADLDGVAEVRRVDHDRPDRWGAALRADAIWFELERAGADVLVPLGAVAEIRRGITSGANEVFYLPRALAAERRIEAEVLRPLLRSPRERGAVTIAVDPESTSHVALMCPEGDEAMARFPNARRWLEEHAAAATRPTLRARACWWSLPARPARVFLTKAYASRFVQRFASAPVIADQRVYALYPRDGVDAELLSAVLNSTYTALALESLGRASMGEGALEWSVGDAVRLPVIDPRRVSGRGRAAFRELAHRPIGPVAAEVDRRDRVTLDRSLSPELAAFLPAAHEALVASTDRRARRARS